MVKMKKVILLFLILISSTLYGQSFSFAVIGDINIGEGNAHEYLDSVVTSINNNDSVQFTLVAGNITRRGLAEEFDLAKEILDKLDKKYFIVPGNTDLQWSPDGGTYFNYLWEDDKFSFTLENSLILGLSSAVLYGDDKGHIKPEDFRWLEEVLENKGDKEVFIMTHHPLTDQFDNAFKLTDIFKKFNAKIMLSGHTPQTEKYSFRDVPGVNNKSIFNPDSLKWGYSIVKNLENKVEVLDVTELREPKSLFEVFKENYFGYEPADSSGTYNHSAEIIWENSSEETTIAEPLIFQDKIITASYSGIVTCFDSTGQILWDYDVYGNIAGQPAVINNIVAVGTLQGDLVTLDINNGSQLQSIGFDESITSKLVGFEYKGTADLMTAEPGKPVYAVAFGTSTGKLYCYHVETLEEIWINEDARALVNGKPIIVGHRMLFGSWDNYIYCIDSRSGLMLWKYSQEKDFKKSPANSPIVSDGKSVYFCAPDGYVTSLDLRLGSRLWRNDKYKAWESIGISHDNRKLFVKASNGRFHIIDVRNGNWVRETRPKLGTDLLKAQIFDLNELVPFSAKNGNVYRLNKKYYYKKVLFIGNANMHSTQVFKDDILLASNIDGHLVMFRIK